MITAVFTDGQTRVSLGGLCQYDKGQVLRIVGLQLPAMVEVDFAASDKGTREAIPCVATTTNGITEVGIPDTLLARKTDKDYNIYAYVYRTTGGDVGETTEQIILGVQTRPSRKGVTSPSDPDAFAEAVEAVNDAAYRAEYAMALAGQSASDIKDKSDKIEKNEAEIADLKSFAGYTEDDVYGVEVDFKNKIFTRLAGAVNRTAGAMFDEIPFYGGRKRVILTDGGIELAAFGEDGYTETGKLTKAIVKNLVTYPVGTPVQVMVRQPKFYYKVVPLTLTQIKYPQMEEVVVTGAATADGTITVSIGSESKTVEVTSGMSADTVAIKIAALAFLRFQSRKTETTVRFISRILGDRDKMAVSFGVTGVTGTVRSIAEEPAKGYHMRKGRYYVSNGHKAGFKLHPAFIVDGKEKEFIYRAAYEPCIYDVSTGLYNLTDEQTGDFTATTGDKLSSVAGAKPCSGRAQYLARANARIMAANRGVGWSQSYTISASATEMLMLIEYASLNMQKAIGAGNVNRSWLEDGMNWSENTGATAALGNTTGAVTIVVPGQTSGTTQDIVMVTYRGEENPWGNIWKFEDGINVMPNWKHDFYIADHGFADSKDDSDAAYVKVGFPMAFTEGYISAFGYDEKFDYLFIASETTGDSSLPVGDYTQSNTTPSDWQIVLVGAYWSHGLGAGVFYRDSSHAVSYRIRYASAGRLVYVPNVDK